MKHLFESSNNKDKYLNCLKKKNNIIPHIDKKPRPSKELRNIHSNIKEAKYDKNKGKQSPITSL